MGLISLCRAAFLTGLAQAFTNGATSYVKIVSVRIGCNIFMEQVSPIC
jgi:hypothetical protein